MKSRNQKKEKKTINMLEGSLWDKILLFALPLAASSMLQQLFNSADTAVVGRFAGSGALAAVGSTSSLINLLVNMFMGLSVGTNVVLSNLIGQGNKEGCKKAVHTSVLLAILGGFLLIFIGIGLSAPVLRAMGTPDDILDDAVLYMRIYFTGMPFMLLYNFEAAIFRSKGDTRRPLIVLAAAGVVNVFLNLFFVIVCKMSVAGVAIATVSSNVVSSLLLLSFLTREEELIRLNLKELKLDAFVLRKIFAIGLPAAVQSTMFNIANVIIQVAMNSLGSLAIAAQSASLNADIYIYMMFSAFSQSAVTFAGQNYGAGKMKRCRSAIRWAMLEGELITVLLSAAFLAAAHPFMAIFTSDPAVTDLGIRRLWLLLTLMPVNAFQDLISGGMRGMGHSTAPAACTCITVCLTRIFYVYFIFPQIRTFLGLLVIYPITWALNDAVLFVMYMRQWKQIKLSEA